MKVIFLDIDGVINTEKWVAYSIENGLPVHDKYDGQHTFDENCLYWLNKIIDETGAQIIISSSWRNDGLGTLRKMWRRRYTLGKGDFYKHHDKIYDTTFSLTTSNFLEQKTLMRQLNEDDRWIRGNQIDIYLKTHPEITKYVIIDDDNDMLDYQQPYFINAKDPNGIEEEHYKKAIEILNS